MSSVSLRVTASLGPLDRFVEHAVSSTARSQSSEWCIWSMRAGIPHHEHSNAVVRPENVERNSAMGSDEVVGTSRHAPCLKEERRAPVDISRLEQASSLVAFIAASELGLAIKRRDAILKVSI